jgi:hypothetical protein
MRHESLLIPCVLAALCGGCDQADAPVGTGFELVLDQPPAAIDALDILFVIDDSGSMFEEQTSLVEAAAAALFAELELSAGGMPDLHLAVVSTDLGVGTDAVITGCDSSNGGRFQLGAVDGAGCPEITDAFLIDEDDGAGGRSRNYTGTLSDAFGCAATLGTDGCGFEQPLEAMRRALDGSNPENAGFLRDDALLLVVFLTDEDDCSTFDNAMFATAEDPALGRLSSFRCFEFGVVCDEADPRALGARTNCVPREDSPYMFPIADYVDFLHGLKADPSMVMISGMFGDASPVEVVPNPDVSAALQLENVCLGEANVAPAVRLAALEAGFPARWVFTSMCEPEMSKRLTEIAKTTGTVLAARGCLLGNVPADPSCRAFAATATGPRRALPICDAPGGAGCVSIERSEVTCSYTPNALEARAPDLLEPGEHLLVECRTAP